MNTQNPAQSADPSPADERVQPDCPLSGEVKRGGVPSTAPAIGQTAVVYQGDRERFVGKIVAKGEGRWRGHWAVQSPRGLREWVGADQLACVTAR